MIFKGKNSEYLVLAEINAQNKHLLQEKIEGALLLIWIKSNDTKLCIDGVDYIFSNNQIVCLTEFHHVSYEQIATVFAVRFNRAFYCIFHNDSEVGCKGLLFFGASTVPIITIPATELNKFQILWNMFSIEMNSKDEMQIEMLQMMLKRLLILTTRLYKAQNEIDVLKSKSLDIIREFNLLVESHFKEKHLVWQYAEMLNKSPKTLSHIFARTFSKSPLQFIHERIVLEAKRLLGYSNKPIKEIAYELGFEDVQTFSRFFKNKVALSPSEYKEKTKWGIIANSSGKLA